MYIVYILELKYIFSYLEKPNLTRAFSHLKIQVRPRPKIFFPVQPVINVCEPG